eukprot:5892796-Pleurochrysis_carterae.AAC.1
MRRVVSNSGGARRTTSSCTAAASGDSACGCSGFSAGSRASDGGGQRLRCATTLSVSLALRLSIASLVGLRAHAATAAFAARAMAAGGFTDAASARNSSTMGSWRVTTRMQRSPSGEV